jgi:superfamily II DNA or RNA helicase
MIVRSIDDSGPERFIGDLSILDLKTEYRSLKEDPARAFYRQCLLHSTSYKRAAGYFRSSVYVVIGASLIEFARRGGATCLICSPELAPDDIDAIAAGYARRSERLTELLIEQIDHLLADETTAYPARVLATLIAVDALEIKLAVRADRKGLYHEKIGVFADGLGNRVSFKGSANETWSGWHLEGNFESIEVFCSWRGGLEAERVQRHEAHFDALWSEKDPDIEVFPFPRAAAEHLKKAAFRRLEDVMAEHLPTPTKRRAPLQHQDAAIEGWMHQNRRGIFQHATGSGKTFTAILALRAQTMLCLPSLIVVPSRLLLEQWTMELRDEIPQAALLLVGAGNDRWRRSHLLRGMTDPDKALGGRIVLATMQTASTLDFINNLTAGEHLLLVADEVHQVGSRQNSRIMDIEAGSRLGLSATPVRYGDPEGTARIFRYFGPVVPPPITLFDAIAAGRLVPYQYFPHPVNLTADEADQWKEVTRAVQLEIGRTKADEDGNRPLTEKAKLLLIQRARIAKKAAVKVRLAIEVLQAYFEPGQSWLVYCEDSNQLAEVRAALIGAGIEAIEYHSAMPGDREATMSWFRSFGGVLVSIRCLDEGVDIPAVSHALILASSQNPRQFIQRRGRVLRRSPGKDMAVIHDAIVVPISAEDEPDQLGLLRSELVRAVEFSQHAVNRGAGAQLRSIAIGLGIDPDSLSNEGVEDE